MNARHLGLGIIPFAMWASGVGATTLTVSDLGDRGPGTLRQAIADSNSGDTIVLAVSGTIILTSGELATDADLTVQGPDAASLQVEAHTHRVWHVTGGVLELS